MRIFSSVGRACQDRHSIFVHAAVVGGETTTTSFALSICIPLALGAHPGSMIALIAIVALAIDGRLSLQTIR